MKDNFLLFDPSSMGFNGSDDLIELRNGKNETRVVHSGILDYFNENDIWIRVLLNNKLMQHLNPSSKGQHFYYPVERGDIIKILGPGKNFAINAKVFFRNRISLEEKKVYLPDNSNDWLDFFMELSTKVESFKLETDYGFILVFSRDFADPNSTRLSYFSSDLDPNKCFHSKFSREFLEKSLPLSNIKEVTAIYK